MSHILNINIMPGGISLGTHSNLMFCRTRETKVQAPSFKRQAEKDTSRKLQAPSLSNKPQASSRKRQAP